jgi:hypothetical protein
MVLAVHGKSLAQKDPISGRVEFGGLALQTN